MNSEITFLDCTEMLQSNGRFPPLLGDMVELDHDQEILWAGFAIPHLPSYVPLTFPIDLRRVNRIMVNGLVLEDRDFVVDGNRIEFTLEWDRVKHRTDMKPETPNDPKRSRPLEDAWARYHVRIITGAPPDQVRECRRAFYAGAWAFLQNLSSDSAEEQQKALDDLSADLEQFSEDVEHGKA